MQLQVLDTPKTQSLRGFRATYQIVYSSSVSTDLLAGFLLFAQLEISRGYRETKVVLIAKRRSKIRGPRFQQSKWITVLAYSVALDDLWLCLNTTNSEAGEISCVSLVLNLPQTYTVFHILTEITNTFLDIAHNCHFSNLKSNPPHLEDTFLNLEFSEGTNYFVWNIKIKV